MARRDEIHPHLMVPLDESQMMMMIVELCSDERPFFHLVTVIVADVVVSDFWVSSVERVSRVGYVDLLRPAWQSPITSSLDILHLATFHEWLVISFPDGIVVVDHSPNCGWLFSPTFPVEIQDLAISSARSPKSVAVHPHCCLSVKYVLESNFDSPDHPPIVS